MAAASAVASLGVTPMASDCHDDLWEFLDIRDARVKLEQDAIIAKQVELLELVALSMDYEPFLYDLMEDIQDCIDEGRSAPPTMIIDFAAYAASR